MPDIDEIYWDIQFWAYRTWRSSGGKSFYHRSTVLYWNLSVWGL